MKRLLGLMTLVVILSGCDKLPVDKVPGLSSVPGLNKAVQQRVTEEMFAHIEDEKVRKHMVAQANATAYRIEATSTGMGDTATQVQEIKINGDDFAMYSYQTDNGEKANEMIMMGDTTYLKDYEDNSWWKQAANPVEIERDTAGDQVVEPIDFKQEFEEMQDTSTYTFVGEEACGEMTCYKYEVGDTQMPESVRTIWFDVVKFLLRREENTFGEFTSTTEYTYDGVDVNAPSPTKDVPEGKSIYDYMIYGAAGLSGEQSAELDAAMEEAKQWQESMGLDEASYQQMLETYGAEE